MNNNEQSRTLEAQPLIIHLMGMKLLGLFKS